jgi:type IV pilus assembly protein PilA
MLHTLRRRAEDEKGFTLIELLVVILIIGILAAIAIPTFLNQKSKANDASAESLARNAATAMETYATNNNGSYANVNAASLTAITPALNATSSATQPYLTSATGSSNSYTIIASSPTDGNLFTLQNTNGTEQFLCSTAGTGSCATGGSW